MAALRRHSSKLFSYRQARAATRTLGVLQRCYPHTQFRLELRADWKHYIRATTPDGKTGYVPKLPLAVFTPRDSRG
jgi:hypothetical protein